jgi:hypothetical protein
VAPCYGSRVPLPDLHPVRGGREAMCGKCLARSPASSGNDTEAWAEILKLGWSLYRPKHGMRTYALCPACTKDPPDIDKEAAAAHLRRKRK